MAKIYEDLTKLVGHTPLVELGHVEKAENLLNRWTGQKFKITKKRRPK